MTKKTFEDRLLTELQMEVELGRDDRPQPARRMVTARRAGMVLAVCAGMAVAGAVFPGSTSTPAYAVEKNPDGTVTLSINELMLPMESQDRLVVELRRAGLAAEIDLLPKGFVCLPRSGDRLGMMEVRVDGKPIAESMALHRAGEGTTEGPPAPDLPGRDEVTARPAEPDPGGDGWLDDLARSAPPSKAVLNPAGPLMDMSLTLRRGDTLVIENSLVEGNGRSVSYYRVSGEVPPCQRVPADTVR
ncbi:hypothetical protein AQ490_10910 [Wenjunlia vitaminophila]|uniref:Uncharacterized protein n=1 Tax=Wenjunlia vitaminophila TaxID=76728 RepID=A0A0T6LK05_WENVI|nr:hypothetical protein [Wenjunlia vitaminophila]KRV46416.1 hypothetical protein AQ490_10910 [Wenjunlia vitaminophila]